MMCIKILHVKTSYYLEHDSSEKRRFLLVRFVSVEF